MQRIIAGGTGLIGTRLINHWLENNFQISVIGRSKEKIRQVFQNRVRAYAWDELHPEIFQQAELVVNLAGDGIGDKRWTKARKQEILQSRINTTKKLVDSLVLLGNTAPPLFNASAIGIYGLQQQITKSLPIKLDETTPINWDKSPDFLSLVAREWEKATHPAVTAGVKVVNLRFGVVLAKEGGALPRMSMPFYFFLGGPIGSGYQPFSWVAIEDVIRAIDFLAKNHEIKGPVNIVSPQCVSQRELAQIIGKILNRPNFIPTPALMLKMVFGEMAQELLLAGQHVYPKRLLELGFSFEFPTLELALQRYLL